MNTTSSEILRHALYFAEPNGWHVFPSPPGTKKSHKSAEYSDGRPWGATRDLDEIRRDFEQWPEANVGVVCGEISGIFVVEADTLAGHGKDGNGRRPVFGASDLFQHDPAWHDLLPFHEYFHADTGAGLGASHQTGWTALVANLLSGR